MLRRLGGIRAVMLFVAVLVVVVGLYALLPIHDEKQKPNIVLIITDDQDVDSMARLPQLNSLMVEKGITFTNAAVASPFCAPSRVSILRGQHAHSHGGVTSHKQMRERGLEKETVGTVLQHAGYRTALIGKYMNGYRKSDPGHVPPGWDEWHGILTENVYYNYSLNENGVVAEYGNEVQDHITRVLRRKALEFIQTTPQDQPFFLYLSTVAPHVKNIPLPQHAHRFEDVELAFEFEEDTSDKPAWVREYPELAPKTFAYFEKYGPEWHRERWRTLLGVDDTVAALINELERSGRMDDTYIVFVSDNGDGITKHIPVAAKLTPYEEGIMVPFVVRGPGVAQNVRLPHLVSTIDILPTFIRLADAKLPGFVDGKSLVPLFDRTRPSGSDWRDVIVVENMDQPWWSWKSTPPMYRLVRGQDFKFVQYNTGEHEYYDLSTDPDEMDNAYGRLDESRRKELLDLLDEHTAWPVWSPSGKE